VLPPSKKTPSNRNNIKVASRYNYTFQQRYKKQEYFIIFISYVNLRQTSSSL